MIASLGTFRWMAPELFAVDDDDDENLPQLTTCTDVWSFAMTVLEARRFLVYNKPLL